MDDLIAFLRARLDEDEAARHEVHKPGVCGSVDRDGEFSPDPVWCSCDGPARVLREVEAKRQIITRCEFAFNQVAVHAVNGAPAESEAWDKITGGLGFDVRSLAAVYADHPDYRQEWAL